MCNLRLRISFLSVSEKDSSNLHKTKCHQCLDLPCAAMRMYTANADHRSINREESQTSFFSSVPMLGSYKSRRIQHSSILYFWAQAAISCWLARVQGFNRFLAICFLVFNKEIRFFGATETFSLSSRGFFCIFPCFFNGVPRLSNRMGGCLKTTRLSSTWTASSVSLSSRILILLSSSAMCSPFSWDCLTSLLAGLVSSNCSVSTFESSISSVDIRIRFWGVSSVGGSAMVNVISGVSSNARLMFSCTSGITCGIGDDRLIGSELSSTRSDVITSSDRSIFGKTFSSAPSTKIDEGVREIDLNSITYWLVSVACLVRYNSNVLQHLERQSNGWIP